MTNPQRARLNAARDKVDGARLALLFVAEQEPPEAEQVRDLARHAQRLITGIDLVLAPAKAEEGGAE